MVNKSSSKLLQHPKISNDFLDAYASLHITCGNGISIIFDIIRCTQNFCLRYALVLAEECTQQPIQQNPCLYSAHIVRTRSWGRCNILAFLLPSVSTTKQ